MNRNTRRKLIVTKMRRMKGFYKEFSFQTQNTSEWKNKHLCWLGIIFFSSFPPGFFLSRASFHHWSHLSFTYVYMPFFTRTTNTYTSIYSIYCRNRVTFTPLNKFSYVFSDEFRILVAFCPSVVQITRYNSFFSIYSYVRVYLPRWNQQRIPFDTFCSFSFFCSVPRLSNGQKIYKIQ